ncbi:apolipoprotein N-acyltransferase [Granulicella pectinivorans]|nr:apolipoprotein N-acyltransferase [Granulicella pectinivorans]
MKTLPLRLWALAILSGMLQVLSFPLAGPVPVWRTALCWVALWPLLCALAADNKDGRPVNVLQATFIGYLAGFVFYLGNCYWIFQTMNIYGGLPKPVSAGILVLFALYLGLYLALFGALMAFARVRFGRQTAMVLAPFLWVAVELARARITGFPWDLLGNAQVDNPLLTRLAPWGGAYAISFVIAGVNALWLIRIRLRERKYLRPALVVGLVVLCGLYLLALRRLPASLESIPTASATLVQENLAVGAESSGPMETQAERISSFAHLSRNPAHTELLGIPELAGTKSVTLPEFAYVMKPGREGYQPTNLIVWPEAPSEFHTNDPVFAAKMHELADSTQSLLIVGSLGVVPDPRVERGGYVYDSAAVFSPGETGSGRYDKIHLVPWGEYIPFKRFFFFANKLTAGVGDMDPGAERTVLRRDDHVYGIFICYESIFGDEVRQFVKKGAEVLVNISDDGWYGDSGAAWQHLNMVRMRAIENHRWILRATNTGITSTISPSGRVVASMPRKIRAAINVPFGYERDTTFYTQYGDVFAYLCALVAVGMLALGCRRAVN